MTDANRPVPDRRTLRWLVALLSVLAVIAISLPVSRHLEGMSTEKIVHEYGYYAIAVGTFLEGETVVAIGGFLAAEKYLRLELVVLVSLLGSYIGHIFWFWLGRTQGQRIIERFPRLNAPFDRVIRLVDRHGVAAIFISQYIYGFRITAAMMFGLSHLPLRGFLFWQAVSCLTWSMIMAGLGYFFGRAIQKFLGHTAEIETIGITAIIVIFGAVFIYHKLKERRKKAKLTAEG